jgi:hypothetical protein
MEPAPRLKYKADLDRLSAMIQELRVEYERFFAGALPVPPEELRHRIQLKLRDLRNSPMMTAGDRFLLTSLEARYNAYAELFNRRLRESEEGRSARRVVEAPRASEFDVREGVAVGSNPGRQAVQALYEGLQRVPGQGPKFDLESFRTYIDRQVQAIRAKTGCDQVQFRLAEEAGTLKLKAKPLTDDKDP